MSDISPELRDKFWRFRQAYEVARAGLEEQRASGAVTANAPWEAALKEVPLTREELKTYKIAVAMNSVNGGTLFASPEGYAHPRK